ncbi:MAG TPA: nitrate reductase molybdenum cofactor assembly chaperone [Solirubrobacteraceae bacterium]|nr:nitrate reductase molybdenum cofactor assembly chaperone [Solirubrobacteraceae bacterium]
MRAPAEQTQRVGAPGSLWRLVSLLLRYPDSELRQALPVIRAHAQALADAGQREALAAFLAERRDEDLLAWQREYVETFDFDRRCTLHLTWYLDGDQRRRGGHLLTLRRRILALGVQPIEGELPDYLPLLLELGDLADERAVRELLSQLRPALELLGAALRERRSPYRHLIGALCAKLGELSPGESELVAELAAGGPPIELVGLEPFGGKREEQRACA